jgi:hypothetical protein
MARAAELAFGETASDAFVVLLDQVFGTGVLATGVHTPRIAGGMTSDRVTNVMEWHAGLLLGRLTCGLRVGCRSQRDPSALRNRLLVAGP